MYGSNKTSDSRALHIHLVASLELPTATGSHTQRPIHRQTHTNTHTHTHTHTHKDHIHRYTGTHTHTRRLDIIQIPEVIRRIEMRILIRALCINGGIKTYNLDVCELPVMSSTYCTLFSKNSSDDQQDWWIHSPLIKGIACLCSNSDYFRK